MVSQQQPSPRPKLLQTDSPWHVGGMAAGMGLIAGSALVGAYAYTRGNTALSTRMVKSRMITVATLIGFYLGSTDMLPPPAFLGDVFGKQPIHSQKRVWPRGSSSTGGKDDSGWQQEQQG